MVDMVEKRRKGEERIRRRRGGKGREKEKKRRGCGRWRSMGGRDGPIKMRYFDHT